jgi:hypothetical protein
LEEAQPLQLSLSSLHSKLEPDSVALKPKLAAVEVVLDVGWLVIEVSGGVVSGGGEAGGVTRVGRREGPDVFS